MSRQHAVPADLGASGVRAPSGMRRLARAAGPVLGLAVLTVVLTARGLTTGGFRYPDASRHAMDGVFVHDFVSDLPGSAARPVDYALKYYARYPALGFGVYYPPFFALVEAVFFALFGISAWTARMTVVAFAVLAVVMLYKLIRAMAGPTAGMLGAALFGSLPLVVFWSRMVMLETPAIAMILTATYAFWRYVEHRRRRWAIWAGLLVVAAVMTKQTAAFIVPAFGIYLLIRRRWDLFKRWEFWTATGIVLAALLPYFLLTFRYGKFLTKNVSSLRFVDGSLSAIAGCWAEMLSGPGMVAALAAGGACLLWPKVRKGCPGVWLLALLAVWFFVESVYVRAARARYAMLIAPVLVSFAPILLARAGLLRRRLVVACASVAVVALASISFAQPVREVRGYAQAARAMLAHTGDRPFVLFDGYYDGDVVFFTRQLDTARQTYLLRGSKVLYTYASFKQHNFRNLMTTSEELAQFLREYGIRTVAVEDKDLAGTEMGALLRQTLKDPTRFRLVGAFPITATRSTLAGLTVLLYEVADAAEPTASELEIPLAGLRRTLTVPVNGRGRAMVRRDAYEETR